MSISSPFTGYSPPTFDWNQSITMPSGWNFTGTNWGPGTEYWYGSNPTTSATTSEPAQLAGSQNSIWGQMAGKFGKTIGENAIGSLFGGGNSFPTISPTQFGSSINPKTLANFAVLNPALAQEDRRIAQRMSYMGDELASALDQKKGYRFLDNRFDTQGANAGLTAFNNAAARETYSLNASAAQGPNFISGVAPGETKPIDYAGKFSNILNPLAASIANHLKPA